MKKKHFLLILTVLLGFMGCKQGKPSTEVRGTNDSITTVNDTTPIGEKVNLKTFLNQPEHLDTVIGDWEIVAEQVYDGTEFNPGEGVYANYPIRFNIRKKGKVVFKNYVVSAKMLMQKYYAPEFLLGMWLPAFATPTTFYLQAEVCIPETDVMELYLLAFSENKQFEFYNTDYTLGGELDGTAPEISTFYSMYAHELSLPHPNAEAIKSVLNRYCTPDFACRMQHETLVNNPLFGTPHMQKKWTNTISIDSVQGKHNVLEMSFVRFTTDSVRVKRQLKMKQVGQWEYMISGVVGD